MTRPRPAVSGIVATIALAALLAGTPAWADEEAERSAAVVAAKNEATRWLEELDAGHSAESFGGVAAVMKAGRNEQDWVRDVMTPRGALGKPVTREMKSAEFSTSVRGAPQGKYVTVVYLTKFAHSTLVNEIVLMMIEDDRWRVAAYSVDRALESGSAPTEQKAPAEQKTAPAEAKPKD